MKKRIALFSVILALSLFGCVACSENTIVPLSAKDQMKSSEAMKANTIEGSASPAEGEQPGDETNVNIITKSDNIYSDAQKLETLNELTGEIEKLIESINNLEDSKDFELIFE